MTAKLTVVYDQPTDPDAFEKHYAEVHVGLAGAIPGVQRAELARVFPKEDGTAPPAYRIAELYFADYDAACAALASPEGQATAQDALTIGTGGVQFLLSDIEVG